MYVIPNVRAFCSISYCLPDKMILGRAPVVLYTGVCGTPSIYRVSLDRRPIIQYIQY